MSTFSMITTDDAKSASIRVGEVEILVDIVMRRLVVYVIDYANDTFTKVDGQYPARDGDDTQSESMMLHGGA